MLYLLLPRQKGKIPRKVEKNKQQVAGDAAQEARAGTKEEFVGRGECYNLHLWRFQTIRQDA